MLKRIFLESEKQIKRLQAHAKETGLTVAEIIRRAADGLNSLRILDIDEKQKSIHIVNQLGRVTWPIRYQRLEEIHNKIHNGEIPLLAYEIDRVVPTWGNYIAGLLKYLGCDKIQPLH